MIASSCDPLYEDCAHINFFFLFLSIYRMTIYFNMKTYLMGGFFWGTPISSTHKTDRNEITVTLFKVSLSTITLSLTLTWVCNSLSKICQTKLNISSSYLHSSESVMATIGIWCIEGKCKEIQPCNLPISEHSYQTIVIFFIKKYVIDYAENLIK
jgi:hypothetical protein